MNNWGWFTAFTLVERRSLKALCCLEASCYLPLVSPVLRSAQPSGTPDRLVFSPCNLTARIGFVKYFHSLSDLSQ